MRPLLIIFAIIFLLLGVFIYEILKQNQTPEEKIQQEIEQRESEMQLKKAADQMIYQSLVDSISYKNKKTEEESKQ